MKRRRRILVLVLALLFLLSLIGLLVYYLTGPERIAGPLVTILSPRHEEQVRVGEVVAVHSTSRDEANKVVKVELWADGELIEVDTHPQGASLLSIVQGWQPLSPGFHTLVVRAFNSVNLHGQATIGVEAVEVPKEEKPPPPEELPTVEEIEEIIESGQVPPGAELPPPPGGLPPIEEVPPVEEVPLVEEVPPAEEMPPVEEVPVVIKVPSPEVIYIPPDIEPEPPPVDMGDSIADEVIRVRAFIPPLIPRIPTTLVEFEALDFEVEEDYDEIYCYASLAEEPTERIPETGFFDPAGGRHWDIAEHLGEENSRLLQMSLGQSLRVFVEGFGWRGDTLHYLGQLDVLHPPEDWDGHIIHASGTGGEGFRLAYRINPRPSAIPAPYNLQHVRVGSRDYLHWMWDGDEEEIDGFRIYRDDVLVSSFGAGERSFPITSEWMVPPCSEEYEYYVVAYQGDFGPEGLESSPSNFLRFEGPLCGVVDDIDLFPFVIPLCGGSGVDLRVRYRYESDHGMAFIGAWPYKDGRPIPIGYVPTRIVHSWWPFPHIAQLTLEYHGTGTVTTDQLRVFMYDSEGRYFYVETFDMPITWSEPRPDLLITYARVDFEPGSIRLEVDVKNAGCTRVEGFTLGRAPLDGEEMILYIDESINPGETYPIALGYSLERADEFRNGFRVTVDPTNLIAELNEENNSYEVIPIDFIFTYGGRRVWSSRPIFGNPDTDGDGIDDNWERVATEEFNPYFELDEEENYLFKRPDHRVINFVRITPYPSKEDPKYILFYYIVSWSRDYGRFFDRPWFEAHNGDTEPLIMAWRVIDGHNLQLKCIYIEGHGGATKRRDLWDPYGVACNEAGIASAPRELIDRYVNVETRVGTQWLCSKIEFHRNRLILRAAEDKHTLYPTCEVCENATVVVISGVSMRIVDFFETVWDWIVGLFTWWKDDHLADEFVVLTYADLELGGVDIPVHLRGRNSHYILYYRIENERFPYVRIVLDSFWCELEDKDKFGGRGRESNEPYLIIVGFSLSPEIRAWVPEPIPPVGDEVDSGDRDEDFPTIVVFEGEVTPESFIGFIVSLFEDDGRTTRGDVRRRRANDMANKLEDRFREEAEAEVGECGERLVVRLLGLETGEDCSGGGIFRFPAYNVGEPDNLLITGDLPGFPGEPIQGRPDCYDKFCGGLRCEENCGTSIYDWVSKTPDDLEKLRRCLD